MSRLAIWIGIFPFVFAIIPRGHGAEYELAGTVQMSLLKANDSTNATSEAGFTIYVKQCSWLIEITERDPSSGEYIKREVGSDNGLEVCELVTSLNSESPTNRLTGLGASQRSSIKPAATSLVGYVRSNAVPVGYLDVSFVGHLWLMFASGCHLDSRTTNRLTPVYDYHASALGNPFMTAKASWSLLNGKGSLPDSVIYYTPDGRVAATYSVLEKTNLAGTILPTHVRCQKEGAQRKVVEAVVTAIRSGCTRVVLTPKLTREALIHDFRLNRDVPQIKQFIYPSDKWIPVKEARRLYESKTNPPKISPVGMVIIGLLIVAPLAVYYWRYRRIRKPIV